MDRERRGAPSGSGREGEKALSRRSATLHGEALEPLERALRAYMAGRQDAAVAVWVEGQREADLRVAHLFRQGRRWTAFDRAAARWARGDVLDVGAGAGAMAVPLQRQGHAVTALEVLAAGAEAMRARGLRDVRRGSIWSFRGGRTWPTVLALMNGTTLAGTRARLGALLARLSECAAPGGRILVDSTAVCGPSDRLSDGRFAGELHFQLGFDAVRGAPFPQLFVPAEVLEAEAAALGWSTGIVHTSATGRYLACLER